MSNLILAALSRHTAFFPAHLPQAQAKAFKRYLDVYLNYRTPTLLGVEDPNIHWLLRAKLLKMAANPADHRSGSVWYQEFNIFIIMIHPFWLASCVHAALQSGTLDAILDTTEAANREAPNLIHAEGFVRQFGRAVALATAASSPTNPSVPPLFNSDDTQQEFENSLGFRIRELNVSSRLRPTRRPRRVREEQGLPNLPSSPSARRRRMTEPRERGTTTQQQMSSLISAMESLARTQQAILASLNAIAAKIESNDA